MQFIDGDFFESLADKSYGDMYSDHRETPTVESVERTLADFEKPIFFIEGWRLGELVNILQRYPSATFGVIAHNSDANHKNIPHMFFSDRLFVQNYDGHGSAVSLPIGLERKRWFPEQRKQETLMEMSPYFGGATKQATNLVYANFSPGTNPSRKSWATVLSNELWATVDLVGNGGDYKKYLDAIAVHEFVASPAGNGLDCHRTWETLYMGKIPILPNDPFYRNVYDGLPVVFVDTCFDITEEYLKSEYVRIKSTVYDLDKLWADYWKKLITAWI